MITMKEIVKEGNDLLKQKSVEVKLPLSKEDTIIMEDMIEYIENSVDEELAKKYDLRAAVGIAAPQIGHLKRMFVVWANDEAGKEFFLPLINPKILSYSDQLTYLPTGEGCLSVVRDVEGLIFRPRYITVTGHLYIGEGKTVQKTFKLKNYISIVFQHEFDHLNGTLFVDKIDSNDPLKVRENSVPVTFKKEE